MTPTERVRSVLAALERHPAVAWVTRAQSGVVRNHGRIIHLCKAGTPDLIGFLRDGRFLGVEVKVDVRAARIGSQTKSTREAQEKFHARATACGCVVAVVSSAEEAIAVVERARERQEAR